MFSEHQALSFESQLLSESVTVASPLNGLEITTQVSRISPAASDLKRIYFTQYRLTESESPQDKLSQISSSITSFYGNTTDEFKYQRIEAEECFGHLGKAESAHLMSREHCRQFETYRKYDSNKSNRLALSRELHGFYDELNTDVPVINMKVISISDAPVTVGRYRVSGILLRVGQ